MLLNTPCTRTRVFIYLIYIYFPVNYEISVRDFNTRANNQTIEAKSMNVRPMNPT